MPVSPYIKLVKGKPQPLTTEPDNIKPNGKPNTANILRPITRPWYWTSQSRSMSAAMGVRHALCTKPHTTSKSMAT